MIDIVLTLRVACLVFEFPTADLDVIVDAAVRIKTRNGQIALPLPVIGADGLAGNPQQLANLGGLRSRIAGGFVEVEPQDKFGHGRINSAAASDRRCPNLIS